jgi:uncharacterized Zn finger protein
MSASTDLKQLLTSLKLRQIAGAKTFEHGADYFATGQVVDLVENAGKITAKVQGTDEYRVMLFAEGNVLAFDCTCPMGSEGAFCKHCVAVGLAWLASGTGLPRAQRNKTAIAPSVTLNDAREWLAEQDKSKLVEMILDQAATSARLRKQLLQEAGKKRRREGESRGNYRGL